MVAKGNVAQKSKDDGKKILYPLTRQKAKLLAV